MAEFHSVALYTLFTLHILLDSVRSSCILALASMQNIGSKTLILELKLNRSILTPMEKSFTPEFIDELVDFINSRVDIPILNEATEAMIFKTMLAALFQLLGSSVFKANVR